MTAKQECVSSVEPRSFGRQLSHRAPFGRSFAGLCSGRLHSRASPPITRPMDEASMVRLRSATRPLATTQPESAAADPNLPMERIILVLKSSPEQEADLEHLIVDQQDHHRWLSPEEFGLEFGRAGVCRCRDPVLPGSRPAGRIGRPRPPQPPNSAAGFGTEVFRCRKSSRPSSGAHIRRAGPPRSADSSTTSSG
jgi:hypothetical protein